MITRHFIHYKFTKKISFSDNTARSLFSIFKPSAPLCLTYFRTTGQEKLLRTTMVNEEISGSELTF